MIKKNKIYKIKIMYNFLIKNFKIYLKKKNKIKTN